MLSFPVSISLHRVLSCPMFQASEQYESGSLVPNMTYNVIKAQYRSDKATRRVEAARIMRCKRNEGCCLFNICSYWTTAAERGEYNNSGEGYMQLRLKRGGRMKGERKEKGRKCKDEERSIFQARRGPEVYRLLNACSQIMQEDTSDFFLAFRFLNVFS